MKREDLRIEPYDPNARPTGGMSTHYPVAGVKVTHIPTGAVSICTAYRQQHHNRAHALEELHNRVAIIEALDPEAA